MAGKLVIKKTHHKIKAMRIGEYVRSKGAYTNTRDYEQAYIRTGF